MIEAAPLTVYLDGLLAGRLRYQECVACAQAVFFPRVVCPYCGSTRLAWCDSSGRGVVYSITTTRSRSGDTNVSLIDLDEGFRMMCRVHDAPDRPVRIGERVEAVAPAGTTPESLAFRRTEEP